MTAPWPPATPGPGDHLARYVDWTQSRRSLLVVTFDKDRGSLSVHILTIAVGVIIRAGSSNQRIDHHTHCAR